MRPLVPLALVAFVFAACGPGSASSPPVGSSGTAPASPSTAPAPASAAPSAAPPSGPSDAVPVPDGPLSPGTYVSSATDVTVTFRVGEAGWNGLADLPGAGSALARDGIEGGVSITTFGGEVFAEPCSPEETEPVEATAEAFVAWLAAHPELQAGEPVETTLAGHAALQLDVTSDVPPECPERPRIWLWVLPTVGDFHLDENEAARFIVADIGEQPTVIVIETYDIGQQAALLDATRPILDSMAIEP